ncbi:MAG: hypothetical protein JXA42_26110 [Anaerolineales bacterium]|nr:hypothetical protein [Anaerolineales bacterium]
MFKNVGFIGVLLALLIAGGASAALFTETISDENGLQTPGLVVLESNAERLLFELQTDLFTERIFVDGDTFIRLRSTGLDSSADPGEPELPQLGILVGLPPEGAWSVKVISAESRIQEMDYPIEKSPSPKPSRAGFPMIESALDSVNRSAGLDSEDTMVRLGEPAMIRGLQVMSLQLRPFCYNPNTNTLEHVFKLVVEVRFDPSENHAPVGDGWDDLLDGSVINYEVARYWRVEGGYSRTASAANPPALATGSLKIKVPADGLYQLDYDVLDTAGYDLTGDPADWQLFVGGEPAAILVEGEADNSFDPGDRVLFYGQAAKSRFTGTNVYWLTPGDEPGLRMESRSVEPGGYTITDTFRASIHIEENHLYDPVHPEINGDHWYWTDLRELVENCPQVTQQYTFSITHLSGVTGITATLGLSIQGYSEGTHNLKVWINGYQAGQPIWQDHDRLEIAYSFGSSWLIDGVNELVLENGNCDPGSTANGMAFNYCTLDYPANLVTGDDWLFFRGSKGDWQYRVDGLNDDLLLLDITDSITSVLLVDWLWGSDELRFQDSTDEAKNYLAVSPAGMKTPECALDQPSDLLTGADGAGYVLVSYGEFLPAVAPLIELRKSQGWETAVIDVMDIYDEFSYGLMNPAALWSFFSALDPIPEAVLLVGDGTIDYLDHLGQGWRNYIPVLPADVDPWWVETAADNRYACLDGYLSDPLPDFHLGRLAVSTLAETENVVKKIVNYETGRTGIAWGQRVLLVADNGDLAGDFPSISDELYQKYNQSGFEGARVYLAEDPAEPYEFATSGAGLEKARAAIQEYWNQGRFLINFTGHSSQSQWALENLFHREDVDDLLNFRRLPVVLSLTCYVNAFQIPLYAPLGEQLLIEPSGGAVATWGPTGGGLSTGHRYLGLGFIDAISGPNIATMGDATLSGKLAVYGAGLQTKYLIDTYVLLGDPAMTLVGGEIGSAIYIPVIQRQE